MNKRITILAIALFFLLDVQAQIRFSIASDFGIQRSFREEQKYWAVGQTIHALFHFSPKDAAYIWVSYYSDGKFKNRVTATAKSVFTIPQQVNYSNAASMRFKQFSIGWKRYLKGKFDIEDGWNIYGYAGFGLILGRVINTHTPSVDTNEYNVSVQPGKGNFKRLTLDLGLGWEIPMGADVFFYTEGRVWLPTTDYPSKFLFVNNNAPFTGMFNVGLRILF